MIKCSVCGKRLHPTKETLYQVVDSKSPMQVLTEPVKTYDVMDCPRCGCQKVLAIRMPELMEDEEK